MRTFRDPLRSNRIGLIAETPDLATWHEALQTEEALEAMKYDGARRDTILEITYANIVIARALYAFAKLGIADLLGDKTSRKAGLEKLLQFLPGVWRSIACGSS